jgi:pimeloyl-ACP methyl ester carboxylesterase
MQVLVLHGNGGVAPGSRVYADVLGLCAKVDVYLLEYPGYGGRGGSPSERSLYQAAEAALGLMRSDMRTFLVGESLGTGVAAYLAGRFPDRVQGVVLLAPYTSVVDVGQAQYPFLPVRWLLRDRFDSQKHLASYRGPIAVIVVLDDTIVPEHLGRSLYEGYTGPKRLWEVSVGGHGAVQSLPLSTWQEIVGFWEGMVTR